MHFERICIRCMKEKEAYRDVCPFCGYDPASYELKSYVLEPLTVLNGKYLLGEVLGAGGFGITYAALDMRLGRRVAVKEFYIRSAMTRDSAISTEAFCADEEDTQANQVFRLSMEKFEKEAMLLAQLEELPGIVRVHELFNENRTLYMVLEYLEGMTLQKYVHERGSQADAAELPEKFFPIMESLSILHDRNILHRDISPDNIMVLENGQMKLFDFGGAKVLGNTGDKHSIMTMRKDGFSPVEQIYNDTQGPWTDEYSLAATMYYCLTGSVPPASGRRLLTGDTLQPPSKLGVSVDPGIEKVILKALSVKREDRYPDIRSFEEALRQALRESVRKKQPGSGKAALVLGGAAAALVVAALLWQNQNPRELSGTASETAASEAVGTASLETAEEPSAADEVQTADETAPVEITWREDVIEDVVRKETGIYDRPLSQEDLDSVTTLKIANKDIRDIDALRYLRNLKILKLTNNRIEDLSPLSGLTELSELWIDYNNVSDLTPLGSLTGLKKLAVRHNQVEDISALAELTELTELYLGGNQIHDISPLGGLEHLEILFVGSNPVADYSSLAGLTLKSQDFDIDQK